MIWRLASLARKIGHPISDSNALAVQISTGCLEAEAAYAERQGSRGTRKCSLGPVLLFTVVAAAADGLSSQVDVPALLALYRDLHAHPNLSHHEERTSTRMAGDPGKAGYTVTEHDDQGLEARGCAVYR